MSEVREAGRLDPCQTRDAGRRERRWIGRLGTWVPVFLAALAASHLVACASDEEKLAGFLSKAEGYAEEEQLPEAVIEYRNAIQVDPNSVEAHRGLARAYLLLGNVSDAYWELSETIRLDPSDRESRNTYAAISLANGRYEAVLEQADALVELDPNDEVGYVLQAQAYERLGREADVEPIMRELISKNPEQTEYRLLLSNFFIRQGNIDEARVEALAAMEIEQTYAGASQMVRIAASKLENDEETERYIQLAIELAVKEHRERQASEEPAPGADGRPDAYRMASSFYVSRERPDDAVRALEAASAELVDAPSKRLELLYVLAGLHREAGDSAKAAAVMQEAASGQEENPEPLLVLSTYRSSQEDFEGALEASEQALALDPTFLKSRLRYAEALVELGAAREQQERIEEARGVIDAVLTEYPGLPEGLFVVAKIAFTDNELDRAVEALGAALEGKPDWPQARLLMGSALLAKGELSRARVEMALALELDPTLAPARRGLVRIHTALNEHEYAIDQGRVYLKERPNDALIRITVAQSLIRLGRVEEAKSVLLELPQGQMNETARFALARIELADGNVDEARVLMEQVEQVMPYHVRVLETFVTIDRIQGRMSESVARVAAAVEAEPENPELHELRGVIATLQGDLTLAEESYERAIELDPKMLEAYSKLASIYSSQGRIDETVAIYEDAVARDPKAADAHHFLAVLYEMTGKSDLARKHYGLAIESDDSMAESKNNLAYLLATRGEELDRALTLAQEAKAAMPGNPNTADTLGWVLLKRDVPSAAIGYFREALAAMAEDDTARGEVGYHLGLGYAAAGNDADAAQAFTDALAHLDKQLDAAQAAGQRVTEPAWASQARAELKRIEG